MMTSFFQSSSVPRAAALGTDDDWKKEVKALFVIRELILTERSYGRHLECLLAAVERVKNSRIHAHNRVSKDANKKAGVDSPATTHLTALAQLLPGMITLSQRLVSQIEADPTAAGVGASFRALSDDVEANFVGWSFAIADIMTGLRSSELAPRSKAQARGRIGMIYVPRDPSVASASARKGLPHLPSPAQGDGASLVSSKSTGTVGAEQLPSLVLPKSPSLASPNFLSVDDDDDRARMSGLRKSSSTMGFYPNARRAITTAVRRNNDVAPSSPRTRTSYSRSPRANNAQLSSGLPSPALRSAPLRPEPPTCPSSPTPAPSSPYFKKALSPLDIVIMPTQRLPRYLLLLRDLQRNTPDHSLSYLRLGKALLICRRVADLCDGASFA